MKKIKEAKIFKGTIVKITNSITKKCEFVGIIRDFEKFKEKFEVWHDFNCTVEKYAENVTLYKTEAYSCKGNLSMLLHIKKKWAKGYFEYNNFYTKEQIEILLNNDLLVAVQGLQEIDLKDLEKLEDSNLNKKWIYNVVDGFNIDNNERSE